MKECKPFVNVEFDSQSLALIKRLNDLTDEGNFIVLATAGGVMAQIFLKSSVPAAAFNITQTDWILFGNSMASVPKIVKRVVQKEIDLQIMEYKLNNNFKLIPFWEAVRNGCESI